MAKTAEIPKILRTITERGHTTVPAEDVCARQARPVVFRGLSDGTVVIAKKEPRADDGDPVIGSCLAFLAHDMAIEPARIRPVPRSMVSRGKALVKGVRVDLNARLPDDKA
jgi:antitoxin PrlF